MQLVSTIQFSWDPKEHTRAMRLLSRPQRLRQLAVFVCVAVLAATRGAWLAAGVATFFGILPSLVVARHARLARDRHRWLRAPVRWNWGPEGISVVSESARSHLSSDGVMKVGRANGFVTVSHTVGQSLIVPERAFADETQLESLVACARELIPASDAEGA